MGALDLSGKRVLVTRAASFMGPALCEVFSGLGAEVIADERALDDPALPASLIAAIAQNFVENPTYFPPDVQATPAFQNRLKRELPLGRLVTQCEDAQFAAYLCSDAANSFVGQIFPICGGWVAR